MPFASQMANWFYSFILLSQNSDFIYVPYKTSLNIIDKFSLFLLIKVHSKQINLVCYRHSLHNKFLLIITSFF